MKASAKDGDSRTLAELASILRSIARKRRSIANILKSMALNYERRPEPRAIRVPVESRRPYRH